MPLKWSPGISGQGRNRTTFEIEATFVVPTVFLFLTLPSPTPFHKESGLGDTTFIDGECKQVLSGCS